MNIAGNRSTVYGIRSTVKKKAVPNFYLIPSTVYLTPSADLLGVQYPIAQPSLRDSLAPIRTLLSRSSQMP